MRLRAWGTWMRLESITKRSGESLKVEVQEWRGLWTVSSCGIRLASRGSSDGCIRLCVRCAPSWREELSCLLVPRLSSAPIREGESGALFWVSSAPRGPGAAGLLFPGDRVVFTHIGVISLLRDFGAFSDDPTVCQFFLGLVMALTSRGPGSSSKLRLT